MPDRKPLTEQECAAICESCLDPDGWAPRPEDLPMAERVRERGPLARSIEHGEIVYRPAPGFRAAAALQAALGEPSRN